MQQYVNGIERRRVMSDKVSEIKFEFSHDGNRMAQAIGDLRDLVDEYRKTEDSNKGKLLENQEYIADQRATILNLEAQRAELSKVVAAQEKEIEEWKEKVKETCNLLSELQRKYTATVERLSIHETQRADENSVALGLVNDYMKKNDELREKNTVLSRKLSGFNNLLRENEELHSALRQRIVWRAIVNRFTARFKQRNRDIDDVEHIREMGK